MKVMGGDGIVLIKLGGDAKRDAGREGGCRKNKMNRYQYFFFSWF
jgi:hypothetical protein